MSEKQVVPADWVDPSAMHTALRKGADSDWSCLLWNLVHMTQDNAWADFVAEVRSWVEEGVDFGKAVRFTAMDVQHDRAWREYEAGRAPQPGRRDNTHSMRTLRWAFRLCLEHDKEKTIETVGETLAAWARGAT